MNSSSRGLLFALLILAGIFFGTLFIRAFLALQDAHPAAKPSTVQLIIDYGDGVEKHYTAVPHKEKMTVLEVMEFAKAHKRGTAFESKGKGETALLTKLDDVSNQGTGKEKLNWIFHVNGKMSDKGFAVYELKAGDVVTWRFQTYKP